MTSTSSSYCCSSRQCRSGSANRNHDIPNRRCTATNRRSVRAGIARQATMAAAVVAVSFLLPSGPTPFVQAYYYDSDHRQQHGIRSSSSSSSNNNKRGGIPKRPKTLGGGSVRPTAITGKGTAAATTLLLQQRRHGLQSPRGGGGAATTTTATADPKSDAPEHLPFYLAGGAALAFQSGYINGCCLGGWVVGAKKQAVAAVTGAYTTSAVTAASGADWNFVRTQLSVLASYIFGSTLGGMLYPTPRPALGTHLSSNCDVVFLIGAVLMLLASALAVRGGDNAGLAVFCLAAVANGLQNSITSSHTGNLIRTTHYSGMSSDIGTFVGQALMGNPANLWKAKVFGLLATAFWLGGFVAYFMGTTLTSSSLLLSAFVYAGMGCTVLLMDKSSKGILIPTSVKTNRKSSTTTTAIADEASPLASLSSSPAS